MIVSVKNFGQIASASIDMSTFSIFVGHNNSGKTMMMQLIYGVIDYLTQSIDISDYYSFGELPITIDNTDFPDIETAVNKVLHEKKDEIVFGIFKRRIPIEDLQVEFGEIRHTFVMREFEEADVVRCKFPAEFAHSFQYILYSNDYEDIGVLTGGFFDDSIFSTFRTRHITTFITQKLIFDKPNNVFNSFFLPASRTGIQLLSKFFFSARSEAKFAIVNGAFREENKYGLTLPMHDFLNFLQEHTHDEADTEENAVLIRFIETNLIGGKLKLVNGEMWYTPDYDENLSVPPQISSSMVNEFAPLMRVLTGIKQPRCIFYDEVETCLHPLKQIQMARLLVRMVNAGYKMIISTHSDTMAAAINNLILLSASEQREQKANDLGYDENDFLKPEKLSNVHVYQFIPDKTGRTVVTELSPYFASGHGYNFDIFNASNDKIYHDAMTILEDA